MAEKNEKERLIDRMIFYPLLDGLDSHPYAGLLIIAFVGMLVGAFFLPALIFFLVFIGYGSYLKSKRDKKNKRAQGRIEP